MGEIPRDTLHPPTVERGHEHTDVYIRPLAVFLAALALSLIVTGGLIGWLFNVFENQAERNDPEPLPLAETAPKTPGPLLQVSPRQDLEVLREREERLLRATQWANRETGVVRIPVEQAMKLIADGGFPEWPAAEVGAAPPGGEAGRAPLEHAARAAEGPGQTTPVERD
jgi:hypothetical protein